MKQKTFKELYEDAKILPTPAASFVTKIAEITHKTENTVRMWLSGNQQPDELTKSVIADYLKSDINTLFPAKK